MGHGGAVGNTDFYAPGDARMPKILGATKSKIRLLKRIPKKLFLSLGLVKTPKPLILTLIAI